MENKLEHQGVGSVPAVRKIMGFLAEAMVGQVRAEVVEQRVAGAVGEEIEVESRREASDVDPTTSAVGVGLTWVEIVSGYLGGA